MSRPENYRQCRLARILIGSRVLVETSWVPVAFAKRGKAVTIDGMEGTWTVMEVYDGVRTREQLDLQRGAQRDVAGVLEPHA